MVDISSQNNKINVTVSSSGNTANTNVTPDYAQYYSEKSKEWAISDKIVDNTDYSSKYYANESKKQADISTAKTTEVITSGNTAVSNIENARDNAINDITNQENVSVDNVNTAGVTQVSNVNTSGTIQINLAKEQVTLATNKANIATEQATIATNKASEVVASGNTALNNIDTAKSSAITDITNLKNTSVSSITTTKNSAITSITNQESTSKNNVVATGNEQIERVNLTGIDNRTPIFSKSEAGTNEGVYQNVYELKHSTFDKSKFTVVGSPTITDDGIASGLNYATAYIKTAYTVPASTASSWSVEIRNFYVSSLSSAQRLFSFDTNNTLMYISQDGKIKTFISGSETGNIAYDAYVNYTTSIGETLNIKFCFTGTAYEIWINNNKTYFINSNTKVPVDQVMTVYSGGSGYAPCIGEHDLKQFSITVDGKEVFSGNKTGIDVINDIEIPYTLSKTGSKIVDVAYRDRVIDLYEQEGQAGYYTIDEPNKNFTLPMGEIYGMIEDKADKITVEESLATKADVDTPSIQAPYLKTTYVNGTSGYRIWSDGYCEQWGESTFNSKGNTISLLKTMKSTEYIITYMFVSTGTTNYGEGISVSARTVSSFTAHGYNSSALANVTCKWLMKGYLASGQY